MNTDTRTLWERVFQTSEGYEGIALRFGSLKVTYPQLKERIIATSERLFTLGVRSGDVVCVCAPNIPQTIYALYALNRIGAVAFFVHPLFPPVTLEEDLRRAKAKMLLVVDQRYSVYRDIVKACPIYTLSPKDDLPGIAKPFYRTLYRKELVGTPDSLRLGRVARTPLTSINHDGSKPSVYLESGGTTGRSKIVMLNDIQVGYPAAQVPYILEGDMDALVGTQMIGALPMFHGFGLAMGVHAPLVWKAVSTLMISYDIKGICKRLQKGQINYLLVIPYAARKLLDCPDFSGDKLKGLTFAFIGADKPPLPLFEEWDNRMREAGSSCLLLEGYGLTETTTVITVNRKSNRKVGSVGTPLPGTHLRIVSPDGKVLPPGEEGEIQIDTPALMLGYLGDAEATAACIATDSDGVKWLKTGDQGHLDEDGFLYFKDRLKNVFKIAGHNVFPNDIEVEVGKNPGCTASAAITVADERHPYIHLFVQPMAGKDPSELISELKRDLPQTLIRYELPERYTALEAMPRTSVGKIDRKVLMARALEEKGKRA